MERNSREHGEEHPRLGKGQANSGVGRRVWERDPEFTHSAANPKFLGTNPEDRTVHGATVHKEKLCVILIPFKFPVITEEIIIDYSFVP